MTVYKIELTTLGQSRGSYVLNMVALSEFLAEVRDIQVGDCLSVTVMEMTDADYSNLPEFSGV